MSEQTAVKTIGIDTGKSCIRLTWMRREVSILRENLTRGPLPFSRMWPSVVDDPYFVSARRAPTSSPPSSTVSHQRSPVTPEPPS